MSWTRWAEIRRASTREQHDTDTNKVAAEETLPHKSDIRSRPPLEILYPGPKSEKDIEVDIIAVHGLGSNVEWSWIWKDETQLVNWLKDDGMLPSVVPKARVMTYSYDSRWHSDAAKTRLRLCGEDLVLSVHNMYAEGNTHRPVIFIGHSLGGNVIINGLLHASAEPEYDWLPKATVGLVFLGSPFRGTKLQPFVDLIATIMAPVGSHRGMTQELEYDNPSLRDTLNSFCKLRNRLSIPVASFFELYETDYGKRAGITGVAKGVMVEEASASIPGLRNIALQTDHFKINKFCGPNDRSYKQVSAEIRNMYRNAKDAVRLRESPKPIVTDSTRVFRERSEGRDCLRGLFCTDPFEDKEALKRKKGDRTEGTCEWLLGTEALTAWLETGISTGEETQASDILWLHGNPGVGKSIISIFLADELLKIFAATSGKTLAYFFCDSSFDTRKTATSILRGLLLQLVQQHPQLVDYILPKYTDRGKKLFESFDALWAIFLSIASDQDTGRKYCIIDALDECDREAQDILLKQIYKTFKGQNHGSPMSVRILITSRPYPEIRRYLGHGSFMSKDLASFPQIKQDIESFIQEKVGELRVMNGYPKSVVQQVTQLLEEKAEGTFLWVGLACTELKAIDSKDAVDFLQDLPKELQFLYSALVGMAAASDEKRRDVVMRILGFVTVAGRPLSLLELSEACQLHESSDEETRLQHMREEIACCRLLVVIQDDKVLLLHQSVRDFLASSSGLSINEGKQHAELAYRCIDRIISDFNDTKTSGTTASKLDWPGANFLDYSVLNWPIHAHMAQLHFAVKKRQDIFFSLGSECWEHWVRRLPFGPDQASILHIAGRYGIPTLVDYIYSGETSTSHPNYFIDSEYRNRRDDTPLGEAVENGHMNVIQRLLDNAPLE